jgi:hypothetical protein
MDLNFCRIVTPEFSEKMSILSDCALGYPFGARKRVHIKLVLGRLKMKTLTPTHLAGFYQDKFAAGFASASVNKLDVVLHKALDQAVKWHIIPRNVAEVVKAPRPCPEEIRLLSRASESASGGGSGRPL